MIFVSMFWNLYLCKSSWLGGLYFFLLGGVFFLSVQESTCYSSRSCGTVFVGHSLSAGKKAGVFHKLSQNQSFDQCIEKCCYDHDCKTALFVGQRLQACYSVQCKSVEACRPVPVPASKYELSIFQKDTKGTHQTKTHLSQVDDPNRPLIREKRHKSCHHYHGTQSGCKKYLSNKLLYFNRPPSVVEKSLIIPIKWLRLHLSQACKKFAVAAVCHYAFPYCSSHVQPSPTFLCQEDCQQLYEGVCKSDFKMATTKGHGVFLPDCATLPSLKDTKCIKLNIPESLQVQIGKTESSSPSTGPETPSQGSSKNTNNQETEENDDEDLNLFKQQIKEQTGSKTDSTEQNADDKQMSTPLASSSDSQNEVKLDDNELTSSSELPTTPQTPLNHKMSSSDEADEQRDLNTPKGTSENNNDNIEPEKDEGKTPTPSSPLGLGLKTSLSLLEPAANTGNDSLASPRETLPTRGVKKPILVNVTNDEESNLDVKATSSIPASSPTQPQTSTEHSNASSSPTTSSPTKPPTETKKSTVPTKEPTGTSSTKPPPSEAPPTLQVSAGHNKVLTLPANSIELYASAFPKETAANPYSYHWQQISAPQDSHGYMEGKDTRRVILSKLSHVGVYQFKVTVKGTANGAFGYAFVNVTVRPVPRVNKPPRADISPKEQSITLPTNEVVLDGSKSSDDDKITQYKWEEVKGPLNDKNKVISSGVDSPVLQLKSLVPGIYTFKLTVVDSDGEKDSTTATVTVNDEKDYPPVARAGNDVVLTLPVNYVTLNGNSSTDNKGIVSYEWSKAPSSPAVGDMQGTNSPFLKVSNMVVGDYTFILKVTDTGGLTSTSKVTVVVQPEKNMPPVAKAGSDKDLVYPDDSTTLDAKDSHDDQKIEKYHWEQESGPSSAEISGADKEVATVKKLQEGHYVFKLTVTDDKGLTGTDTVAVNVKKDINKPPAASAGPDVVVHLPNRAAELDGSKSTDDHGITKYIWHRDPKSPAAGDVINNSDHQAVLRLSNLVEGMYKFKLTVQDAKGLESSDEALLTVKEDENSAHLVELYLDVDITRFTEENKGQLIRKLAVILDVQDNDIVVEHLKEAGTGHSMMVMFYVKGGSVAKDGQAVAEMLKSKIENEEGFFEFRMLKVEPYICRNNCSFHGYCDRRTKLCVCESFWMQDIFKSSFGVKESNCDWSILYVTVIIFGIVMGIGGIIWAVCFCMGRRRRGRSRRRHRYAIIDEDDDDDKAESMEMLPKHNYSNLTLTDSDEDSDETTLFEAKKRLPNGSINGSVGRKAM